MRPKDALYTKWSDAKDSVWIGGAGSYQVSLLGSNLTSSVLLCEHSRMEGFVLAIPKGKKGVAAVRAFLLDVRKGGGVVETNFFVNVDNSGEEPDVDLNEVWVPSGLRMGHINGYGYIEVLIDDERFTTDKAEYTHGKHKEPNTYTVDGNTLVRYLVGDIEADEVRATANVHIREKLASEQLPGLLKIIDDLKTKLAQAEQELDRARGEISTLDDRVERAERGENFWQREWQKHVSFLSDLHDSLGFRAIPMMRVKTLIRVIGDHLNLTKKKS